MPRFYPNGSPKPDVAPAYLVVTPRGAWACDTESQCLAMARQLAINGVRVLCLSKEDDK